MVGVGRAGGIGCVQAAALLRVEEAANLVEAVGAFEALDLEEAREDRFVEEPLAAGRAGLFGDEADGGVVVDGLAGDVEVLGDLGDAVEFAGEAEEEVALGVVALSADVPQVLGDGLEVEPCGRLAGIAAGVWHIADVHFLAHLATFGPRKGRRGPKNGFDSLVKPLYRTVVKENFRDSRIF